MKCVFADDSYPMRERLRAWLRNCGQEVVGEASSAREAYAVCASLKPELAILDVLMPPGDGRTTAIQIKQDGLAHDVVVVTSNSQKAIVSELMAHGILWLAKPLGEAQLAHAVNEIAKRQAARPCETDAAKYNLNSGLTWKA